ncbi:hypothetical protein [Nocardia sp. CC227C]|uniref:hypothetical protein n=1 Tax=Nocardia sp. CC227C TaxID=3044562 RepID=UPI00278BF480|nr:hypothetical protein [Nocardia sp. CC227C]
MVAYDAEAHTLTYHCPDDSSHDPFLREQAMTLVAHSHPHRVACQFDLWLAWKADRAAALAALEEIEKQYADTPPLRPVPICETCGQTVRVHRSHEREIWFCSGRETNQRHLFRDEKRNDLASRRRLAQS